MYCQPASKAFKFHVKLGLHNDDNKRLAYVFEQEDTNAIKTYCN